MSGGFWNYKNDEVATELFGWRLRPTYGKEGWDMANAARHSNPLEDREISELVYDVFCLLHSFDWYKSGDTSYETYETDLIHFKEKWFNRTDEDRVAAMQEDLRAFANELINELGGIHNER